MGKSLDSSAVFNQENYHGRISEVSLMEPIFTDAILSHVIEDARRRGYKPISMAVVNLVYGSPEKNEPTEAILCGAQGGEGIIVTKHFSPNAKEYRFYLSGEWNYIP